MSKRSKYQKPIEIVLPGAYGKLQRILIQNPAGVVLQLLLKMGHGNCDSSESRTIRDESRNLHSRVNIKSYWKARRKKKPLRECDKLFIAAAKWSQTHAATVKEAIQKFKECGWSSTNPVLPVIPEHPRAESASPESLVAPAPALYDDDPEDD